MSIQLTPNACSDCMSPPSALKPDSILQILNVKVVVGTVQGQEQNRYRLIISDGTHFIQAMATTSLNPRFALNEFETNCVVRVRESIMNKMDNGRYILIILSMDVVSAPVSMIGSPTAAPAPQVVPAGAPAATTPPVQLASPAPNPSGPIVRQPVLASGGSGPVMPINSLNPYSSNKWTIKARVTSKGEVRNWTNARGAGKLFSVDLLDELGGEIRGTFFNQQVDKFEPLLEKDKVYLFSGGKLKLANKQFTSIRHEYEITFEDRTTITPVADDARIARVQYSLVKLNALESLAPGTTVDVVGIVVKSGDVANLTSKKGQELTKRDLSLADATDTQISVTLWGDKASLAVNVGDVLALKSAKLGDYGGRSISTWGSTGTEVNPPDMPEAAALLSWWAAAGADASGLRSLTERGGSGGGESAGPLIKIEMRRQVKAIRDESLGNSEKGDLIIVKAAVAHIRPDPEKMWYPACPNLVQENKRSCNKKLTDNGGGQWMCNTCGSVPQGPVYRYILTVQLQDTSGTAYATLFDAEGAQLLGKTANEMAHMVEQSGGSGGPDFDAVLKETNFKEMLFSIKIKMEYIRDEQRLKGTVVKMRPIEYAKECRALLDVISKFPQSF